VVVKRAKNAKKKKKLGNVASRIFDQTTHVNTTIKVVMYGDVQSLFQVSLKSVRGFRLHEGVKMRLFPLILSTMA